MLPTFAARATMCLFLLTLFAPEAACAAPTSLSVFAGRADSLYSVRAKRRIATFLRLKVLEMRKADLDRAALVIEHRLGIENLFTPANPVTPAKDARRVTAPRQ